MLYELLLLSSTLLSPYTFSFHVLPPSTTTLQEPTEIDRGWMGIFTWSKDYINKKKRLCINNRLSQGSVLDPKFSTHETFHRFGKKGTTKTSNEWK